MKSVSLLDHFPSMKTPAIDAKTSRRAMAQAGRRAGRALLPRLFGPTV